ncbi:6810_t:CDS:2, partial [Gigaspora rosea]
MVEDMNSLEKSPIKVFQCIEKQEEDGREVLRAVQGFEQEENEEKYNWWLFWSTLKGVTGIRCTTLRKSK